MVAQPRIPTISSDDDIQTIIALHDNPVNILPRWLKINLVVSRVTVYGMLALGGPAMIASGILTRDELKDE